MRAHGAPSAPMSLFDKRLLVVGGKGGGGRTKWDLVILDGPATGHLITMLLIPQAILDAVPEGPLTRPAAATMALLRDPQRTAMVLVTLAEDLPSNEAIELAARAKTRVQI